MNREGVKAAMDHRFNAEEWSRLTPAEQIQSCRLMAEEARTLGETAPHKIRENYLSLATQWLALGEDIALRDG